MSLTMYARHADPKSSQRPLLKSEKSFLGTDAPAWCRRGDQLQLTEAAKVALRIRKKNEDLNWTNESFSCSEPTFFLNLVDEVGGPELVHRLPGVRVRFGDHEHLRRRSSYPGQSLDGTRSIATLDQHLRFDRCERRRKELHAGTRRLETNYPKQV